MLQGKDVESLSKEQLGELFLYGQEPGLGSIYPKGIDSGGVQDIERRVGEGTRGRSKNHQV